MLKKRNLIISISIIPAVYAVAWFAYAEYIKTGFLSTITKSEAVTVSYDSAKLEGFPFNIGIRLQNPKAKIKSGKIVKDIIKEINIKAEKKIELPDVSWEDELSLDGNLFMRFSVIKYLPIL